MGVAQSTFDCTVCLETVKGNAEILIADDAVCIVCFKDSIQPMFEEALLHEHKYPVRWGNATMQIADYVKYLPKDFEVRWAEKEKEYKISVADRIYCPHETNCNEQCGRFLGARLAEASRKNRLVCTACEKIVCGSCKAGLSDQHASHACDPNIAQQQADPFYEMLRGKDYQLCPKCKTPVNLRDGCNHIICEQSGCGQPFCYICGEAIGKSESDHFKPGKPCPRFNQPGAANALHDGNVVLAPVLTELDPNVAQGLVTDIHDAIRNGIALGFNNPAMQHLETLLRHLIANLAFQSLRLEDETVIERLERRKDEYISSHEIIEERIAGMGNFMIAPEIFHIQFNQVAHFYRSRHQPYLDAQEARLDALWATFLAKLPNHLDRTIYRSLQWPAHIEHARDTALAARALIEDLPVDSRTPLQNSLETLCTALITGLSQPVELRAVVQLKHLVLLAERWTPFVERVVEEEFRKIEAEDGWRGHLDVRLAVEVWRNGSVRYKKELKERIEEMRLAEAADQGKDKGCAMM